MELILNNNYGLKDNHPIFDASDIYRCGTVLFVQIGFTTNKLGFQWIKRTFPEFEVKPVYFENNTSPVPISYLINIPRPGHLIYCPNRPPNNNTLGFFKKRNWNLIPAPPPSKMSADPYNNYSPLLYMNILSLNEKLVIVEQDEKKLIQTLNNIGIDCIPIPFRDVYKFGGSFHSHTLDIYRESSFEDFFS